MVSSCRATARKRSHLVWSQGSTNCLVPSVELGATLLKGGGSDAAFWFRQSNDSAPLPWRSDGGVWRVACGVLCVVCCVLLCCCVVCFTWFFQCSEQVSSVTYGRRHEANGRTGAGRDPSLLGSAVHGAQCFGCFEGQDKFQLPTPLSHRRVGAAGRLRNRCLPRQLFEKAQSCAGALSSTLRACAWPLYLRGLSCSA